MALDRYSSDKGQRKAPETNPDLINFLSDRFDLSYFDLIFATAMKSEGYTTGQGLCHDYPLPTSKSSQIVETPLYFPLKLHLWRGAIQTHFTKDCLDCTSQTTVQILAVRLPNNGACYREVSAYHSRPIPQGHHGVLNDWSQLHHDVFESSFPALKKFAEEYLDSDQNNAVLMYNDHHDRLDIYIRPKDPQKSAHRFQVSWERGTPQNQLPGSNGVPQYIDAWSDFQ